LTWLIGHASDRRCQTHISVNIQSSDALLTTLSYNPATMQKRLGDGFYEQQLIREQEATVLAAGNNLLVTSAQDDSSTSYDKVQKNTGLTVTSERIDVQTQTSHATQSSQTTQAASTIASEGDTTLVAGNQLVVYASSLSAGQTLTLQGADVNLQAGLNTDSASEQNSSGHTGISIGVHVQGITPKSKDSQDQQNTTLDAQNIEIRPSTRLARSFASWTTATG